IHDLHDLAIVDLADFRLGHDAFDPFQRGLDRLAVGGGDLHRAVVFDVDLGAGLFDDLADHLAARPDHFADLVGRDLDLLDARGVFAQLLAAVIQGFVHFAQDVQTATLRLFQRDLHDLFGDAGNLDVHLQRGDTVGGAGDLEVHIAEMIFVTQDVRQNDIAMAFHDEAHGDARRWLLQGNARIHQRQRGAAHGRHRGRTVRLRNFGDDA